MKKYMKRAFSIFIAMLVLVTSINMNPLIVYAGDQTVSSDEGTGAGHNGTIKTGTYTQINVMTMNVSYLAFNTSSLAEAEEQCQAYMSSHYKVSGVVLWDTLQPGLPGVNRIPKDLSKVWNALGSDVKKITDVTGDAGAQNVLYKWLLSDIVNKGSWSQTDRSSLNALFTMLHNQNIMSDPDYEDWCANKNNPDSGRYYIIVFSYSGHYVDYVSGKYICATGVFPAGWDTKGWSSLDSFISAGNGAVTNGTYENVKVMCSDKGMAVSRFGCENYITYNGKVYPGRGYWGAVGGDTKPSDVSFAVAATPQDKQTDLSAWQTGHFLIHLKGDASTYPKGNTTVTIKAEDCTSYPSQAAQLATGSNQKYVQIGARVMSEGGGTGVGFTNYTGATVTTSGKTVTFTLDYEHMIAWLTDAWHPIMRFDVKAVGNVESVYLPQKFSITITNAHGTSVVNPIAANYAGWDANLSANYISWKGINNNTKDISWEYHSPRTVDAYAEIVANSAAGGDWNVMQGIPSTENLAVVGGGTFALYDLAGWVHIRGSQNDASSAAAANSGKGTLMPNVVKRQIRFIVTEENTWGTNNTPCTLSCPGHTESTSWSMSVGGGEVSGDESMAAVSEVCPHCNQTVIWPGLSAPGYDIETDPKTGAEISRTPRTNSSGPTTHTCDLTITYHCDTGTWDPGGSALASATGTKTERYGQGFNGSATATSKGGDTITASASSGLIDEGFTIGKGCQCSHEENMIHVGQHNYEFFVYETIDMIAWKEITAVNVWALASMEIAAVDTNVINSNTVGMKSSGSTAQTALWRGPGFAESYATKDVPKDCNQKLSLDYFAGRIYFTQYIPPQTTTDQLKSRCASYISTAYNWGYRDSHSLMCYWLSDVDIVLHTLADQRLADSPNPGALDAIPSISNDHSGYDAQRNFSAKNSSDNTFNSSSHTGDSLSEAQRVNQALHVVNGWQYLHKDGLFYALVVSDAFSNGSHWSGSPGEYTLQNTNIEAGGTWAFNPDSGYQNIVNGFYSVDNGIKLFDEPFTAVNEIHYRNHRSQYSEDTLATMASSDQNAFAANDLNDGLATVGYIGQPSDNPLYKYRYVGDSFAGVDCYPYEIYMGSNGGYVYNQLNPTKKLIKADGSVVSAGNVSLYSMLTYKGMYTPGTAATFDLTTDKPDAANNNRNTIAWIASWAPWAENSAGTKLPEQVQEKAGYYTDYKYPGIVDGHMLGYSAGVVSGTVDGDCILSSLGAHRDFGGNNIKYYGTPYVISNIDIQDNAANGIYNKPMTVNMVWIKAVDKYFSSTEAGCGNQSDKMWVRGTGDIYKQNAVFTGTYVNSAGQSGVINDIVIQDPISVDNWGIIGNGYGAYAPGVTNEAGEDMRVYQQSNGSYTRISAESDKNNYLVVGNTFHLWVSDEGDFYDSTGSWAPWSASTSRGVGDTRNGSDIYTGAIQQVDGYTNNMNTSPWIRARYVRFTFPVSYIDSSGNTIAVPAGNIINLSDVKCTNASGDKEYLVKNWGSWVHSAGGFGNWTGTNAVTKRGSNRFTYLDWISQTNPSSTPFHSATDALQNFKADDNVFTYGLDYEFTLLPSATENTNAEVQYYVEAINAPTTAGATGNNPASRTYDTTEPYSMAPTNAARNGYKAPSVISDKETVEIVGRIGNLAIEDVGDFRYSELFKKVEDYNSWLIPGVIHNTEMSKPNTIIATRYEILGDDTKQIATDSSGNPLMNSNSSDGLLHRYNHAQSSITNYIIGTTPGFGKAGNWLPFPLTSAINPVDEYKNEQMKMGYYVYLDVETIGNYYGINWNKSNDTLLDGGPISIDDLLNPAFVDTRENYLDIVPKYFLYDMDTDKFYSVYMYYGNQGQRTLFWKNNADIGTDITSLYVNLDAERYRRNTTTGEQLVTNHVLDVFGPQAKASVFSGEDFIGTASHIRLDAYDRSFIGSTLRSGYLTGSSLPMTVGLTSGVTSKWYAYDNTQIGTDDTRGTALEDSVFGQQEQRWYFTLGLPSSTYLTYAESNLDNQAKIEQSHERLEREHPNAVLICYLDMVAKGTTWDLEYNAPLVNGQSEYPNIVPGEPFPTSTSNIPVYRSDGTVDSYVPKEWQPTVVYDPYHTSAEDWDTYGTH